MNELYSLIDDLARKHTLALEEYEALIKGRNPSLAAYAAQKAVQARQAVYNNDVYSGGAAGSDLRAAGVYPGAHRIYQRLPQRLLLLRHTPKQQ